MKSTLKYLFLVAVMCATISRLEGQTKNEPVGSQVKVDLLGLYHPVAWYFGANRIRFSLEYEKVFANSNNFSWVIDTEYSSFYYDFEQYDFVWPPNTSSIPTATLDGWTTQFNYSALFGIRLFGHFQKDNVHFRYFVEPRIGLQYRHASLNPDALALPALKKGEIGIVPKMRQGLTINFGPHWGSDLSVDILRYIFIARDQAIWRFSPELNLTYRF